MMVVTESNFSRPLFSCNEGAVQFGSVMTKYPMCYNDRPMGEWGINFVISDEENENCYAMTFGGD